MTTGIRKTHDFCFLNLMTNDAKRAKAFFSELLGWGYGEMPGIPGGSIILVDGKIGGAMMDMGEAKFPPGTPPHIGVVLRVDDADASAAKVKELGGRAEATMDVMENGRMVPCWDPNGVHFGLWQPKSQVGFDGDSRAHGAPTWFETLTTDAKRAATFYTSLFGWTAGDEPLPGGASYTVFSLDGVPVAGAMKLTPEMGDAPPHWATAFAVTDADAIARRAKELGGTVTMEPMDIPKTGRFAAILSPDGVHFEIVQWSP